MTAVRAVITRATAGRGGSSNPGGPSGGGGWNSSAGIYYSLQDYRATGVAGAGNLGPFYYPQITGDYAPAFGELVVGNNVWNGQGTYQQWIFVANPGQWEIIANFEPGNTAVLSYPSLGQFYNNPPLQNFTSFYSTFNETQPHLPGVIGEAGYDCFWSDYANEIMFQHDMVDPSGDRGYFATMLTETFGGTGGVPEQEWSLGIFGAEIVWQLTSGTGLYGGGVDQGSVDVRQMTNWLADRGYMAYGLFGASLTLIGYGWEICSTGGVDALYRMNGFTSNFTYSPMETSPGLELHGFTISGPASGDTINNVTVNVTEYQSSIETQPCTIELWDYSSTPAQTGTTQLGARSTSNANVSSATFYGVTYAQLATLRVRVFGNMASGYTESVGGVSLSVNYTPAPPPDSNAGFSISMGMG